MTRHARFFAPLIVALALSPAAAKPRLRAYTVQPGDSLWSIAAEL